MKHGLKPLIEKIKKLASTKNKKEIAKELCITVDAVRYHCKKHGIKCVNPMEGRSFREMERIVSLAKELGVRGAAEKLGVSIHVIKNVSRRFKKKLAEQKKEINDKTIEDMRRVAIWYCNKKGYYNDAEDFAQWVCLEYLRGRRNSFVAQLWVDYMRKKNGRACDDTEYQKNKLSHNLASDPISGTGLEELSISENQTPSFVNADLSVLKFKNKLARAYIYLSFKYGLTNEEIGEVFGVSGPRVCQVMNKEIERIRSKK
jgi:DNA-directed RNA polymerase specialized sigma24 family protein